MRKLTLNADEEVIEAARRLTREQGTSISSLFARFVRALDREARPKIKTGRLTRKASGLMQMDENFDERRALGDALLDKYMGKR